MAVIHSYASGKGVASAVASDEEIHRTSDGVHFRTRVFSVEGQRVAYLEVSDVDAALERAIQRDAPAPYGAVPWASAFVIADQLARLDLTGKTVIDVGAGCGVVSLVSSKLGARVIALEIDELARELLARAADMQDLAVDVRPFDLLSDTPLPTGDLYVFADLLYEEELAQHTAKRVIEIHHRGGGCVWVGDPKRRGRHAFRNRLRGSGYSCVFQEVSIRIPDMEALQHVGIYSHAPARWADVW